MQSTKYEHTCVQAMANRFLNNNSQAMIFLKVMGHFYGPNQFLLIWSDIYPFVAFNMAKSTSKIVKYSEICLL